MIIYHIGCKYLWSLVDGLMDGLVESLRFITKNMLSFFNVCGRPLPP